MRINRNLVKRVISEMDRERREYNSKWRKMKRQIDEYPEKYTDDERQAMQGEIHELQTMARHMSIQMDGGQMYLINETTSLQQKRRKKITQQIQKTKQFMGSVEPDDEHGRLLLEKRIELLEIMSLATILEAVESTTLRYLMTELNNKIEKHFKTNLDLEETII